MNNYIPFLKLKTNEIMALKVLEGDLKQHITPFFDFPRKENTDAQAFVTTTARLLKSIEKNLVGVRSFYLDNFDVVSNFNIGGQNNYAYLIDRFSEHEFIPVVSIDRSEQHIKAVKRGKIDGKIQSNTLALRLIKEDFENHQLTSLEIEEILGSTFSLFNSIDLVFDCRFCSGLNASTLSTEIASFIKGFSENHKVRRVVITGSSIPASIGELIQTESSNIVHRNELDIYHQTQQVSGLGQALYLGDYTIVSPNYSDVSIAPQILGNIMTPKIVYSFGKNHQIIRGGALRTHERGSYQYNDFSKEIVDGPYYRGSEYSFGDNFLQEKGNGSGSLVTPSSILKPTINAHITFMMLSYHWEK